MIDYNYIVVNEKLKRNVLNVKAVRDMFEGSDHYVMLAKIKIKGRCETGRKKWKRNY